MALVFPAVRLFRLTPCAGNCTSRRVATGRYGIRLRRGWGTPVLPSGRGARVGYDCGPPRRPGAQSGGTSAGPRTARSPPHSHLLRPAREWPLGDAGYAAAHGRFDGEGSGGSPPDLPHRQNDAAGPLVGRGPRRALRGRISRARRANASRWPSPAAARTLPRAVQRWRSSAARQRRDCSSGCLRQHPEGRGEPLPGLPGVEPNLPPRGCRHARGCVPHQGGSLRRDADQPPIAGRAEPEGVGLDLGHGGSRRL